MKKFILVNIGLILSIYLWGCSARTVSSPKQNSNESSIYENKEYNISLNYNKDWKPNNQDNTRYEGKDGFFIINAYNGKDLEIDEVATREATHILKPYGSNPQISKLTIRGQESRLIMPSADQQKENNNQAEVIIKYPKNIKIDGNTYFYFILYADKNNIEKIAKTIKFIS